MNGSIVAGGVLVLSSALAGLIGLTTRAAAQAPDHSLALTMKLDELVEQLPVGRYRVRKSVIDANGMVIGKAPLRDDHICIKTVGQVAPMVSSYAATFDLSILAWKATGANCRSAFHGDAASAIHETVCKGSSAAIPPSRWNVLETDSSCKFTYTESSRQKICSDASGLVHAAVTSADIAATTKPVSSNHYLAGAILVPGQSLRLHLREFDTTSATTKYVAGHAIDVTLMKLPCEASDRLATSLTD
jgi:hypothetical protein